ncbi:MAG: hypothetical protein Q9225_004859 [Loekoesia sp. 1 TL-2023]
MAEPTSPIASSSDGSDNDPGEFNEGQWVSSQRSQSDHSSATVDAAAASANSPKPPPTMPKRRRVTRACDECRRKKIKCDGKQPCTHCTVYSYDKVANTGDTECTYDQPSNRRRNPTPQYVEALENRLQRAEQLLRQVRPDVNLDDPLYDAMMPQRMHPPIKLESQPPADVPTSLASQPTFSQAVAKAEEDSVLESMVHEAGSLALDDQGHWDFYGHSSGMIFLRRMREQFGDLLGKSDGIKIFFKSPSIAERFSTPGSSGASPMNPGLTNVHDLPAKVCARKLCSCALDDAAALLRFVHQPSFYLSFDRVYDTPPEEFTPTDQKFLPLLYSVLALGCLFAKAEESMLQSFGYESAIDQGFNWFQISRQLMDVTDCRDLTSLQALLFMIMFLQASAKLSTCFSHIGIALTSAIRMGLHRRVSNQFSPIEQESRKRIFWVIRNMDVYVGALLGLPMMLSDEDIDQEFPLEVDDDCITADAVLPMPPGKTALIAAFTAHIRLVRLLAKTVRYVYPLQTTRSRSKHAYAVSYSKIREVEQDLHRWMEDLPMALRPGGEVPPELVRYVRPQYRDFHALTSSRVQQLLRIAYGHIQIMLYRPFLHYASQTIYARKVDKRSYACAAACVSVSRNIIHITAEMKRRGLLTGAYWFTMYTTFFAVLSLLFYVLENPHNAASHGILRDAHDGRDTLADLASRSMAADRSSQTLKDLFDQLPEAVKIGRLNSVSQKKRSAPTENSTQPKTEKPSNVEASKSSVQSPTEYSSTSSGPEDPDWKLAFRTYKNPTVLGRPQSNFEPIPTGDSRQTFPNPLPNTVGLAHNTMATGSVPSSATQSTFSTPNTTVINGFPDLTPMMFPSNDPFAYPNQPMTTFENLQDNNQNQPINLQMFNDGSNSESGNNFSAPFYASMPAYPIQQGTQRSPGMGANQVDGETQAFDGSQGWTAQPQAGFGGPGTWDAMFGEDWSGGWTDHGYRQ